jgi:hypothetical protein
MCFVFLPSRLPRPLAVLAILPYVACASQGVVEKKLTKEMKIFCARLSGFVHASPVLLNYTPKNSNHRRPRKMLCVVLCCVCEYV